MSFKKCQKSWFLKETKVYFQKGFPFLLIRTGLLFGPVKLSEVGTFRETKSE